MARNTLARIHPWTAAMRRTALALSLAALAAFAWAQPSPSQWKWRDASGQLHISDMPPPASVPSSAILERPTDVRRNGRAVPPPATAKTPEAAASTARPAQGVDPELEARRKRAEDEKVAQQKLVQEKNTASRAENCARARSHLVALNDGLRLTRTNERGEREVLDDKGRAEEMQRARAIVASDCK
jgi:type IV secretory pathway VirB10-like protein